MQDCELCGSKFEVEIGRGSNNRISCYVCTSLPDHRRRFHRNKNLKRTYGLTMYEQSKMVARQENKCAVCSRELDMENSFIGRGDKRSAAEPVVDHCHSSGNVRGILCFHCNTALGHAFDSPDILNKMIAYLSEHNVH